MPKQEPAFLRGCTQDDGGIMVQHITLGWIHLLPGDDTIVLDGEYTAIHLRALADWIDYHNKRETRQ